MTNDELIAELAVYPNGLSGSDLITYAGLLVPQALAALTAAQSALAVAKADALEEAAADWAAAPDAWGDNDKDYRNELRDRAAKYRPAS